MRPLDINLSSNPYRNDTPILAGVLFLALCAFALTGWNAYAYFTADANKTRLLAELAGHRDRMAQMRSQADAMRADLQKKDQKLLAGQAEFVSSILDQRNFSWTQLFNALERVTPWDCRLVSIRPAFQEDQLEIDISGIAQDMDAFLDFQDRLLNSPQFGAVVPGSYSRSTEGDQRIFFTLRTGYVPGELSAEEKNVAGAGGNADEGEDVEEGLPADDAAAPPTAAPPAPRAAEPRPAAGGPAPAAVTTNAVRSAEAPARPAGDQALPNMGAGLREVRPAPRVNPNARVEVPPGKPPRAGNGEDER